MEPYSFCPGPAEAAAVTAIGLAAIFIWLLITILVVLVFCKIFAKTGYSWALGLLMFIPIANIIMLFVLAFSEWPIQKELKSLKAQIGQTPN